MAYWIKDSLQSNSVAYFDDDPSLRDAGNTYIYTNGADLCGPKSYEIVMVDQSTSNTDTAFLNLQDSGAQLTIEILTIDP